MLKASVYSERVTYLQELIATFKILETEIKFRMDPLPESFRRVGNYKKNKASLLLVTAGSMLAENRGYSFAECWENAVLEVYEKTGLTGEDICILKDMSIELGKSDMAGQSSMFERVNIRLTDQLSAAVEDKKTKGKMYRSLGFAIGAVIVILLV